ncbi:hypothetical protein [Haloechinothrix sp. LS1_15]|uniref:hypothetical protein n=1 Tax=Haloechinothrix sp. LS1_15 TaxID=2652248 RepID=UPI002948213A|nr:hypothetical protein [Haloechinothrix sp. LS1_15]MDV6011591.1 hypothetical protein [Haloechinothrix sp. LS1_15]
MRVADVMLPAPKEVRLAGALVMVPGILGVGFAFTLLFSALLGSPTTEGGNSVYGEAAYYVVLGGGTLACGVALLLGQLWARAPAVVVAVVQGGAAWYMLASSRPELGVPVMAAAIAILVLLFREPSRAWALGLEAQDVGDDDGGDARRGGQRGGR